MKLLAPPLAPEQAAARIGWFIRLRWFAAAGTVVFPIAGRFLLGLQFPVTPFVLIGVGIALYNTLFLFLSRKGQWVDRWSGGFASIQVVTDILVLTVLMHFGGGIENPFVYYFLFHTIITAILLPGPKMDLQVLFAVACVVGLVLAEYTGLLGHRHIEGLLGAELYANGRFVAVTAFAVITTLCVTAFLAASIAERLHERERLLADANAQLSELDVVKSQYVMRVAHDLAEPAGMITSCLKLVTQGLAGQVPEKAMDMVCRAQRKSEYIGLLIKDLLSLARIKAAKEIPKTEVDLGEIIEQVFEEVQPHVIEKNLTLQHNGSSDLPAIYGNADAICELISNLVTNAVKYTLVDGRVEVSTRNSGQRVLVEVRDNGVGIPAEAIPHIYEEFYRADNVRAEAVEGTGLGLSIVSRILDAHDGKIWVKSKEGEGTKFSFTLPVAEKSNG